MPIKIKDVKHFKESISGSNLSVIHFAAKWSDQCTHINEILDELSKQTEFEPQTIQFCYCEAEDLADISLQYKIEAVPTILLFRQGTELDRVNGTDAAQLTQKIRKYYNTKTETSSAEALNTRLKQLITRNNVMMFIKGTPENPRCGFTRQLIQIVNGFGIEYDTFDILQDEQVRQGLKTYSDWPTYPQLYVKGEFIGGLDIVKEMQTNGELETLLKA